MQDLSLAVLITRRSIRALCLSTLNSMFEKYTGKARRVIFHARYEVSVQGSPMIETVHLLLGLLREDEALLSIFLLSSVSAEALREQIESSIDKGERISTSIEIPLSDEAKRVLKYAAEESEGLGHAHIGAEHLLLGLLRERKSFVAEVLQKNGVNYSEVRRLAGEDSWRPR
jgi:ATP-dependent Clp protease ATP-binding subunit ClpC